MLQQSIRQQGTVSSHVRSEKVMVLVLSNSVGVFLTFAGEQETLICNVSTTLCQSSTGNTHVYCPKSSNAAFTCTIEVDLWIFIYLISRN